MPEFLTAPFANGPAVAPLDVFVRLFVALLMGFLVAGIYRWTRHTSEIGTSFPATLVLLAVLIAMVTQVIGDNIARAFSLVGALSIVRFRTVVRDTQDTAYVIFAVVMGMAIGAKNPWVAGIGLGIIGLAAFIMMARSRPASNGQAVYELTVRVAVGPDLEQLLGATLNQHLETRELVALETSQKGAALDVTYHARLRPKGSPQELVQSLNRIEGVTSVELERRGLDQA
jgi:hypothetical protein